MTGILHIPQEDPYGCGIAAIAMVAGISYPAARAVMVRIRPYAEEKLARGGFDFFDIDAVLAELGFAVCRRWRGAKNVRPVWPLPPFGERHIVQVYQPQGGHMVVMDRAGAILDPATGPTPRKLSDWAEVDYIAAVVAAVVHTEEGCRVTT